MAEHILILGAGRSSAALIDYLARCSHQNNWSITVGDLNQQAVERFTKTYPHVHAVSFNLSDSAAADQHISTSTVVVSLLPPALHQQVANRCLHFRKHLVTASYVQESMQAFHHDAKSAGLIFLNECGLDPGIDHMSAMQVFDRIRNLGGEITGFRSFTGGLIAPETDPENHWRYKFTWNSKNVVTAGQGIATYLDGGKIRRIPYAQLFRRLFDVSIDGLGKLDGYANRDSLRYKSLYGLHDISTLLRGTLRFHGFCQAWNILAQLGCCDDTLPLEQIDTHAGFMEIFLPPGRGTLQHRIASWFHIAENGPEIQLLTEAGLFTDEPVGMSSGTAAALLEHILNKRWKLQPGEKDLVVMWHQFVYEQDGQEHEIHASLSAVGQNDVHTAMARTVGLPLGMAARLIAEHKIESKGVCIPIAREFYDPILLELEDHGIQLKETQFK